MEIQISGKNMDLGDALQAHVNDRLAEGVKKYFERGAEAAVTFSKERNRIACEMTTHLDSGVFLSARDEAGDAYGAFDGALEKMEKRVRRYKRRLKNHHVNGKDPLPAENASYFLLEPLGEEPEDEAQEPPMNPVVVAEGLTKVREMTVGNAVMQLDLAESPAIVFKNAAHGRINVVYRRHDGNIGWIDPKQDTE
ncbi:MAG: ribosome-associated translation inhibitor RaiA [Pseudomonadota bacterium]